jgi:hypothetical protein
VRPEAFVEYGVIEDQVGLRIELHERLELLPKKPGREFLAFEVAVYGVVAPLVKVLGQVGQGVVDLAAKQILAIVQLCKAHTFRVAALLPA